MDKFEPTSQEALNFNKAIIAHLLVEVVGHPEAYISDRTCLSDFSLFCENRGKKINDKEWAFTFRKNNIEKLQADFGHKNLYALPKKVRKDYYVYGEHLVADEDVTKDQDLLDKIKKSFGVELKKEDLKLFFPQLALKIASQISPEKRKEIEGLYDLL